jgi:hypothetical protein
MSSSKTRYKDAPSRLRGCRCDNPLADPRVGTCAYCGHQVDGVPMPFASYGMFKPQVDETKPARKRRPA